MKWSPFLVKVPFKLGVQKFGNTIFISLYTILGYVNALTKSAALSFLQKFKLKEWLN